MKLTAAILTATIVMTLAGTATGQSDGSATMNQAVGVWKIVERTIYLVEFLKDVFAWPRSRADCDPPRDSRDYCHFLKADKHGKTVRVLIWDIGSKEQCKAAIEQCAGGMPSWDKEGYPKKRPTESFIQACRRS